jgi:endonuclease/exonuclease/phosphatase family metal-dependent hydrolase
MRALSLCIPLAFGLSMFVHEARAEDIKIVSWNAHASLPEHIEERTKNFKDFAQKLKPDVVVLVEVTGLAEALAIARNLGWAQYHGIISNFSVASTEAFQGLEVAVISKKPVDKAVEFDAFPEGEGGSHRIFTEQGVIGAPIAEQKLSVVGMQGVFPLERFDRGRLRVDLGGDTKLSIFPVHLKSNRNSPCGKIETTIRNLEDLGLEVPPQLLAMNKNGFDQATEDHRDNARQRERVIAAVEKLAEQALAEGRVPVIAGDFNTGFEPGKAGNSFADCTLQNFSCESGPFPALACRDGDGYDDTLAILENGLVGNVRWAVLSKDLPRTYQGDEKPQYADRAIDHIAVPLTLLSRFTLAERPGTDKGDRFGSDHYPITTTYHSVP